MVGESNIASYLCFILIPKVKCIKIIIIFIPLKNLFELRGERGRVDESKMWSIIIKKNLHMYDLIIW